jgi:hypothetical protein
LKKIVVIFFLGVFVFQCTSNLFILYSFFINRDYISENLCINRFDKIPTCKGQCYLGEKLKENEKKEQKFPNLKVKETQLLFHQEISKLNISVYTNNGLFDNPLIFSLHAYSSNYLTDIFHPPQFIL